MPAKLFKNVLAVSLALNFLACSLFTPASTPTSADIEKEEQAVYSFFVGNGTGTVILLKETATDISQDNPQQTMDYIKSGLKNISSETFDHYLERNAQPAQLAPDMQLGVDYILLSRDELSTIMRQPDGWDAFYAKYSHAGYTQFSRVGFNKTLDQAVLYVGQMAGPLMGSGFYYLMEKQAGQWKIKEQIMMWIS